MAPSIIAPEISNSQRQTEPNRPAGYQAFDHVLWYVGNAKQAASYYVTRMGFKHVAYVLACFTLELTTSRKGLKRETEYSPLT